MGDRKICQFLHCDGLSHHQVQAKVTWDIHCKFNVLGIQWLKPSQDIFLYHFQNQIWNWSKLKFSLFYTGFEKSQKYGWSTEFTNGTHGNGKFENLEFAV